MEVIKAGDVPFGEPQGSAPNGVVAFSNGSDAFFSAERNFDGEVMTGFKWQCVEYARRWLLEAKGLLLPEVSWAAHIFSLTEVARVSDGSAVRMVAVPNATDRRPEADTLIIYPSSPGNMVGHIGVVTEVGEGWVRVCDQNHRLHKWQGNYSVQLPVEHADGKYTIRDGSIVPLGWMTFPETPNRNRDQSLVFHESIRRPVYPPYELKRVTFIPKPTEGQWLDLSNPAQAKFARTFGTDLNRSRLSEQESNYYLMNLELWFACVRAGNDLHKMCIEATRRVLADDALLDRFGIHPRWWARIRRSFEREPRAITGRFDFVVDADGKQLKMFEYNADSASTLLECAVIQGRWKDAVGLPESLRSMGFRASELLELAWHECGVPAGGKIHFLVDKDDEEEYTALLMMENAQKAGYRTELVVLFDDLRWRDGVIVDKTGDPVTTVWKTWAWETAFADYDKASATRGESFQPANTDAVRLCDVLLGPNDIRVFEPMWKAIPSNKAILAVLWQMFPNHENLLRTEWQITPELRATGYARKPIVGRCGRNITICNSQGETVKESTGEFTDRDLVFQELFQLPKRDDYYAIMGGWIIGSKYGGTGIREDKTVITNVDSPFSGLFLNPPFNPRPVTAENALVRPDAPMGEKKPS